MSTPKRDKQLQLYFEQVRDWLRLSAWDIKVDTIDQASPDALLQVSVDERRHFARIVVGTFWDKDPNDTEAYVRNEQKQAVIHELLHVVHSHTSWWFDNGPWADFDMSKVDKSLIEREVRASWELIIDFTARALAPAAPEPPIWDKWPDDA